jgi:hypothetical protein
LLHRSDSHDETATAEFTRSLYSAGALTAEWHGQLPRLDDLVVASTTPVRIAEVATGDQILGTVIALVPVQVISE